MDLGSRKVCLICFNNIKKNIECVGAEEAEKIFESCLNYLHTAIANSTTTLNNRLNQSQKFQGGNQLPFCKTCYDLGVKLVQMSEKLDNFKKEFSDFNIRFSMSVLQRRNHCGVGADDDSEDEINEIQNETEDSPGSDDNAGGTNNSINSELMDSDTNSPSTTPIQHSQENSTSTSLSPEVANAGTSQIAQIEEEEQLAQPEEEEQSHSKQVPRPKVGPRKMVLPEEAQKCISKKLKYALTTYQTYCQAKDINKKTSFVTRRLEQLKISKCPYCGQLKGAKSILLALHILKQQCHSKSK